MATTPCPNCKRNLELLESAREVSAQRAAEIMMLRGRMEKAVGYLEQLKKALRNFKKSIRDSVKTTKRRKDKRKS